MRWFGYMRITATQQRLRSPENKKDVSALTHRDGKNVLETPMAENRAQASPLHKRENVLELARELCVLANAAFVYSRRPDSPPNAGYTTEATALLLRSGWNPELAFRDS